MVHHKRPQSQKNMDQKSDSNSDSDNNKKKKLFVVFDLNGTLMAHTYASPLGEPSPSAQDARPVPGLKCMCTPKAGTTAQPAVAAAAAAAAVRSDEVTQGSGIAANTSVMFDDAKGDDCVDSDTEQEQQQGQTAAAKTKSKTSKKEKHVQNKKNKQQQQTKHKHKHKHVNTNSNHSACQFDYSPVAYRHTVVHKRPHLCALFDWVFEHCEVAVWTYSGMTNVEATALARATFGPHFDKLAGVFCRSDRPACKHKDLNVVWKRLPHWNRKHTILVDDSRQKMLPTQKENFVFIDTYSKRHFSLDTSLVQLKQELERRLARAQQDTEAQDAQAAAVPEEAMMPSTRPEPAAAAPEPMGGHLLFFAPSKDTALVLRLTPFLSSLFTVHHYSKAADAVQAVRSSQVRFTTLLTKLGTRGNLGEDIMKAMRQVHGKAPHIIVHSATATSNADTRAYLHNKYSISSFAHAPTERTVLEAQMTEAAAAAKNQSDTAAEAAAAAAAAAAAIGAS